MVRNKSIIEQNDGEKPLFVSKGSTESYLPPTIILLIGIVSLFILIFKFLTETDKFASYELFLFGSLFLIFLGSFFIFIYVRLKKLKIFKNYIIIPIGFWLTKTNSIPFTKIEKVYLNEYSHTSVPYNYIIIKIENNNLMNIYKDDLKDGGYKILVSLLKSRNINIARGCNWWWGVGEIYHPPTNIDYTKDQITFNHPKYKLKIFWSDIIHIKLGYIYLELLNRMGNYIRFYMPDHNVRKNIKIKFREHRISIVKSKTNMV